MGALRKTMQYLGLVDTGDEADDYAEYDEPRERSARRYDSAAPPSEPRLASAPVVRRPPESRATMSGASGAAVAVAVEEGRLAVPDEALSYRITTLQPRSYNEAPDRRGIPRRHARDHEPHRDG